MGSDLEQSGFGVRLHFSDLNFWENLIQYVWYDVYSMCVKAWQR